MNDSDKKILTKCHTQLAINLIFDGEFQDLLIKKQVFSSEVMEDIKRHPSSKLDLLNRLMRRGPKDFQNFRDALEETYQNRSLQILEDARRSLSNQSSNPSAKVLHPPNYAEAQISRTPETETISNLPALPNDVNFTIKVKSTNTFKGVGVDGVYQCVQNRPRGLVLLLNYNKIGDQEPRKGSEFDVARLSELFKQLDYKVIPRLELNYSETLKAVQEFRDMKEHAKADSTIVVVMSHGEDGSVAEGTRFFTSDGNSIGSETLIDHFNNDNCPKLQGKPKIFLFQFCRGSREDTSPRIARDGHQRISAQGAIDTRLVSDMLIVNSTLPGFVSHRYLEHGSLFMWAICRTFMKYAWEDDVFDLLRKADQFMQQWATGQLKQTFEYTNRAFSKKFFFNPGYVAAHVQ